MVCGDSGSCEACTAKGTWSNEATHGDLRWRAFGAWGKEDTRGAASVPVTGGSSESRSTPSPSQYARSATIRGGAGKLKTECAQEPVSKKRRVPKEDEKRVYIRVSEFGGA